VAVAALPRRQKTAIILRYFLDLSIQETAHHMGCSEGTVKALTHQATRALRSHPGLMDLTETHDES
jgi:RNA polymerase sigma factor (sigma-70 family)